MLKDTPNFEVSGIFGILGLGCGLFLKYISNIYFFQKLSPAQSNIPKIPETSENTTDLKNPTDLKKKKKYAKHKQV